MRYTGIMKVTSITDSKIHCPECGGRHLKFNGHYTRIRNRRKVQRYKCLACDATFSDQTFDKTYRQKRPDLLETVLRAASNSNGIRRMAADLRTTTTTVQRKVKFLHKICESFHVKHLSQWDRAEKPRFQFDELWSVEGCRWQALTVPIVVEKDSYFIVSARAAYDFCKSNSPQIREFFNERRKEGISEQDKILKRAIKRCLIMKPQGRIVIESDRKTTYPEIIKAVVGTRLVHERFNAGDEDEKKKLFPVNNAIACLRAEKAMLRRESWYITKNKNWLNRQLALYTLYSNYMRIKRYTHKEKYEIIDPDTGKKVIKTLKSFEKKTPAMQLGIFNRPIGLDYVLKHG